MKKKIKEIIWTLGFMSKVGDVSKIALDNLKTALEELDEELTTPIKIKTINKQTEK
tara:strand:+ start:702 stop:869 length:168 start_codon:yes stop_codon:yes gene_type:complete